MNLAQLAVLVTEINGTIKKYLTGFNGSRFSQNCLTQLDRVRILIVPHNASLLSVMQLLSSEFFKLVAVATLVSWPIAYLATNYWLTNFTERLPTNLWIYIGATLTVAMVGSIAISFQTIKASTSNPVDSLKSE